MKRLFSTSRIPYLGQRLIVCLAQGKVRRASSELNDALGKKATK